MALDVFLILSLLFPQQQPAKMAELKKAPTDTRIYGSEPDQFRDVDSNLLALAKEQAKKAVEAGLPAQLAAMLIPLTILEGNARPFGVTKGQDVAAARIPAKIRASIPAKPDSFGRLKTDGVPIPDASLALLADKHAYFVANNKDFTVADVLNKFNGEKDLEEKTGKPYSGHVEGVLRDILENPKNREIQKMIKPFLGSQK